VAGGYYNLGHVTELTGDLVKAELYARESLRIRNSRESLRIRNSFPGNNDGIAQSMSLLAVTLQSQGVYI
jgi:hypothetical protein